MFMKASNFLHNNPKSHDRIFDEQRSAIVNHMNSSPKLFVIDTNVILHDADCIQNFEENDIAIPIVVLEELDRFKKGSDDVNFQARAFLRAIDELTGDALSPEGACIGDGLGAIRVVLGAEKHPQLCKAC
jgi:PhoH-like ATPase